MTASIEPGKDAADRLSAGSRPDARQMAETAGKQAAEFSKESKAFATDYVRGLSAAAETGCEVLEGQGHKHSAEMLDRMAAELGSLANSFEGKGTGDVIRELQSLAHRRPAMFFSGALLAGFGLSRFLKSTAGASHTKATDR